MRRWDMVLETHALVVRYGDTRALDGISLRLDQPGVYALLGPNGAGKSSLVHTAVGLHQPASGSLRVFGGSPARREVRARIGVMLQETELPDTLTALELLRLQQSFYPDPNSLAAMVERCALHNFADQRYGRLSGGQKRRVQLALALIGNPSFLFLDEPTPGLDPETRRLVWREVRSLVDRGATVLLTTHDLQEADALADQVIILNAGRIVSEGTTDEVRARVTGSLLQCSTRLSISELRALPGITEVRSRGRLTELVTRDPPATLRVLLDRDPSLSELTVRAASLEEALQARSTPTACPDTMEAFS